LPSQATEMVEGVVARGGGKRSTRGGPRWWPPSGNLQRHFSQDLIVYRASSARGIQLAAGRDEGGGGERNTLRRPARRSLTQSYRDYAKKSTRSLVDLRLNTFWSIGGHKFILLSPNLQPPVWPHVFVFVCVHSYIHVHRTPSNRD